MTIANQRVSRPALAAPVRWSVETIDPIVNYPLRSGSIASVVGLACALLVPSAPWTAEPLMPGAPGLKLRHIEAE